MPTGHFTIGDLSFSFEGDLKELAHCQEIMREIRRAEQRLRRASGSDRIVLIYDRNLEGERGTFDKMRLRAYDDTRNYTLDIGSTDNNPLGIYVGYDQNIEVYDRESGETWQIDPEGNQVEGPARDTSADTAPQAEPQDRRRDTPKAERASAPQGSSSPSPSPSSSGSASPSEQTTGSSGTTSDGPSQAEVAHAANTLRKRAQQHPSDQRVGETSIPGGPLGEKVKGFASYCGRDEGYLRRVLDTQEVGTVDELAVGQVPAVLDMIADEETLRQNEQFEPDDDLPF